MEKLLFLGSRANPSQSQRDNSLLAVSFSLRNGKEISNLILSKMKRLLFLATVIMLFTQQAKAQTVQVGTYETFDGVVSCTVNPNPPARTWSANPMFYQAYPLSITPKSYHGLVPTRAGDSIILTTGNYNCFDYTKVYLRFSQICKVSPRDAVRIEYRINNAAWQRFSAPFTVYMGNATNFLTTGFNAASYGNDWKANDSTAVPQNSWWRDELFDVSYGVGGEQNVQFRFIIKRGNIQGTQLSYGWLIDNIEVLGSSSAINLPVVQLVSPYVRDTVYSTGPYEINAKVKSTSNRGIMSAKLYYMAIGSNGAVLGTDSILMTKTKGDTMWVAKEIPQFVAGTKVLYFIEGKDSLGNVSRAGSSYIIKVSCGGTGLLDGDYPFTGNVEQVTLNPGIYQLECWGADG